MTRLVKDTFACRDFLSSTRGAREVEELVRTVTEQHQIHAIPLLVVDGQYFINGTANTSDIVTLMFDVMRGPKPSGRRMFDIPTL
jgi:predicted DsbA family dithiol-disulfide isomerase